jgi:hypothetical protein
MRKLFVIALFVLGIYNAPMFGMAQEIILSEVYSFLPYDGPEDNGRDSRPGPNRFQASIDGNQLSIDTGTDAPAYAEVIDPETGEVVAEEEFEGETTMSILEEGDYEVYIYTESGTVMVGEFSVK